jgi:ribonuclease HI
MGKQSTSTIYAAELVGTHQALDMALKKHSRNTERGELRLKKTTVFTDNQPAIQSCFRPGTQSGQYILRRIAKQIRQLHGRSVEVWIRWIPAHTGIPGNEYVGRLAKGAAKEGRVEELPGLRQLQSSCKRTLNQDSMENWTHTWERNPHGTQYRRWNGKQITKGPLEPHAEIPKALSSVVTQMRTGKIGLRSYLYSIKRADTGICQYGQDYQTVRHVVCECPLLRAKRQEIMGKHTLCDIRLVLNNV